jgi:hypothetical protein
MPEKPSGEDLQSKRRRVLQGEEKSLMFGRGSS